MKILGIDYGDTRTGLALADPETRIAFTAGVVTANDAEKAARKVADAVAAEQIGKIVIGLPKNMDGSLGFRAKRTEAFAASLGALMPGADIVFYDERLTTRAASYYLNETNTRGAKRKKSIDTLSAQIILQNYLDSSRDNL